MSLTLPLIYVLVQIWTKWGIKSFAGLTQAFGQAPAAGGLGRADPAACGDGPLWDTVHPSLEHPGPAEAGLGLGSSTHRPQLGWPHAGVQPLASSHLHAQLVASPKLF